MSAAWPVGLPRSLDYPEVGVGAILAGSARRYPERAAFVDGEESLSYRELHDRALRLAAHLTRLGVRAGDTVALMQPNSLWFPVSYYGALLAGAVVSPVNPAQPALALADQLKESAAVLVLAAPECLAVLDESGWSGTTLTTPLTDTLGAEPAEPAARRGDDLAHLTFTGGTTGRSKAVRVLQRNVVANVLQAACWRSGALPEVDDAGGLGLRPVAEAAGPHVVTPGQGVTIAVAPFFHAMGLLSLSISVLQGATVVLGGRFEPARFLDLVERHGATALVGSPPMFRALLADPAAQGRDLVGVRLVNSGAAPIDRVTLARLQRLFPQAIVTEGYGLTEATMGLTLGPVVPTGRPVPFGTVGLPVFDTELEIRALDGGTDTVPTGEVGEVWARGPQITDGYHGHPELTAEQFVDGWLRTGDLGRVDEDGFLFIEGRAKDMLIYKGYNVYPQHLEEVLCTHPDVAQASVVGVPSEGVGEIPVAYVVLRPGTAATEEQLSGYVAERVVPYARLRGLRLVEQLPVSAAGKILKNTLREAWARG